MRRVYLESPFKAPTDEERAANRAYLNEAIRFCIARNWSPFASHQMFTAALDDDVPEQRSAGIAAGLAWGEVAEATVVFVDRGISGGMTLGIIAAKGHRPVEYYSLRKSCCVRCGHLADDAGALTEHEKTCDQPLFARPSES